MHCTGVVRHAGGKRPPDGIADHLADVLIEIDWIGLMSRAEAKDLAFVALESATAAKDFAALEPTDENQLVGLRNIKELAVHLCPRQCEVRRLEPINDGMSRIDDP